MGQRAPETSRDLHQRPRDRFLQRAQTDRPAGGAQWQEDAKIQQENFIPIAKARECLYRAQVPRDGRGAPGQHRLDPHHGLQAETDHGSHLDPDPPLLHLHAHV